MKTSFKKYQSHVVVLLLVIVTIVVYWPIRNNGFVDYDDGSYITDNPIVQRGLTTEGVVWAFTSGFAANWHPLTWISHMLDCQLYGLNPLGHHLTNLLLHILSTILLFILFQRMTGAVWASAFVAAIFALHPLHVESVAWTAERKDVLSTFFWMLTMLMYAAYVSKRTAKYYLLTLLAFALGLLSKPMTVTLPFVLLLMDYWPLGRIELPEPTVKKEASSPGGVKLNSMRAAILPLIREKLPFFALTVVSSILTFIVQQRGGAVRSLELLPLPSRIANALLSYLQYIGKTLWPSSLAIFYPYSVRSISVTSVVLASIVLICISYWVIRLARKLPPLFVGWLWYLGTLVPVIGIVQVGSSAMDDRYMYVPLIGLSMMIAWGIPRLLQRWKVTSVSLSIAAGVVLMLLAVTTQRQVGYWHDTITLFDHAQQVTTDNYVAHSNLAIAFTKQGKIEEALDHYRESLRINPTSAEMHSNMGTALIRLGRIEEATFYCEEAVRIKPDHPVAQYNLGLCLAQRGNIPEAINHYAEAIRLKPDYTEAHLNLANLLARYGSPAEAEAQFSELLQVNPHYQKGYLAMGYLLASEGKLDDAIGCYTKALQIQPDFAEAHYCLGLAFERQGNFPDAIQHFGEAVRIKPGYAAARAGLEEALQLQQQNKTATPGKHP